MMPVQRLLLKISIIILLNLYYIPSYGSSDQLFDNLLKAHVKNGRVNYLGFKNKKFDQYLSYIATKKVNRLNKKSQLAFYINAYNAICIKQVLDHFNSIKRSSKGVLSIPNFFKQKKYRVGGRKISLDELENKIIRPIFKEPRIHFALVCAARGCPILPNRAYTKNNLERLLQKGTSRYLHSNSGIRINKKKKMIYISKIFLWYKKDFGEKKAKNHYSKKEFLKIRAFINRYRKDIRQPLYEFDIQFIKYNWRLNNQ